MKPFVERGVKDHKQPKQPLSKQSKQQIPMLNQEPY